MGVIKMCDAVLLRAASAVVASMLVSQQSLCSQAVLSTLDCATRCVNDTLLYLQPAAACSVASWKL
jgi:hypothetical protein